MLESHVLHKIQVLVVVPVHLGTDPTCTRVLHSNSASERRPLVVRLFPSSQLKENSVAQVVFPSSGPENLVIACLRLLLYHTTYIRYVHTSFRALYSFLLDSAGSFLVDCPTTYLSRYLLV